MIDTAIGWQLLTLAVVLAVVAFFVAALASILRHPRASGTERAIWVVAVLAFPLAGPFVWFWLGRESAGR